MSNKVVYFHNIDNKERVRRLLTSLGSSFNFISIGELEKFYYEKKDLKNSVHITFDDGDLSFYRNVFPFVKSMGIPVSLFVSPLIASTRKNFWFQEIKGYDREIIKKIMVEQKYFKEGTVEHFSINVLLKSLQYGDISRIIQMYQRRTGTPPKKPRNMSVDQLMEINESELVNIGAHTLNHPILMNETDSNLHKEIVQSIDQLSKLLGNNVRSFAYPNGFWGLDFHKREMEVLSKTDIRLAFSTELRNISRSDNLYAIPRFSVNQNNYKTFKVKLALGRKWILLKELRSKTTVKKERLKLKKHIDSI